MPAGTTALHGFNGLGGFDGLVFRSVGLVEANKAYQGFQDLSLQFKVTAPGSDRLSAFAGTSLYEHDILGRNLRITPSRPYVQIGSSRHIEYVSVFGSLTWSLTEKLALGLDVRWQKDDVRESTAEFEPQTLAEAPSLGSNEGFDAFEFDTASFERTLPRFIVDYKPNDDATLYAVIAQGNKPGFCNNRAVALIMGVDPTVKEETIWNYEIGASRPSGWTAASWSTRPCTTSTGQTEQIRQTFLDAQFQDSQITTNAGETEVYGFELESSFVVTERLVVSRSVSFADPRVQVLRGGNLRAATGR